MVMNNNGEDGERRGKGIKDNGSDRKKWENRSNSLIIVNIILKIIVIEFKLLQSPEKMT